MLLEALGVPEDAIALERDSRNTRQNAVFTEKLAVGRGIGRVLLVTSHWHLRRAEAAFRRVGMEVIPVATDYGESTSDKPGIFMFIPRTGTLKFNSVLFKEYLGYLVYRLRGWGLNASGDGATSWQPCCDDDILGDSGIRPVMPKARTAESASTLKTGVPLCPS